MCNGSEKIEKHASCKMLLDAVGAGSFDALQLAFWHTTLPIMHHNNVSSSDPSCLVNARVFPFVAQTFCRDIEVFPNPNRCYPDEVFQALQNILVFTDWNLDSCGFFASQLLVCLDINCLKLFQPEKISVNSRAFYPWTCKNESQVRSGTVP